MKSGKSPNSLHVSKVKEPDAQMVVRLGTVGLSTQEKITNVAEELEKNFFALIDENSQKRLDAKLCQLINHRQPLFAKKAASVISTGPDDEDKSEVGAGEWPLPSSDTGQSESFFGRHFHSSVSKSASSNHLSALASAARQSSAANAIAQANPAIPDSKPTRWRRLRNKRYYFNDEKYSDLEAVDESGQVKKEVGTLHLSDPAVDQLAAYLFALKQNEEAVKKKYLGEKTVYVSPRTLALRVAGFAAISDGAVPMAIYGGLSGLEALGESSPSHMGSMLGLMLEIPISFFWAASNALGIRTDRGLEMLSHYRRATIQAVKKLDEERQQVPNFDTSDDGWGHEGLGVSSDTKPVGATSISISDTGNKLVGDDLAFIEQPQQSSTTPTKQTTDINEEFNNLVYRAHLTGEESYVRKQRMVVAALAVSGVLLTLDALSLSSFLWLRIGLGAFAGVAAGATKYYMYKQQYEREAIAKHRRGDIDAALQKQLISRLSVYGLQPATGDIDVVTTSSAGYTRQVEVDVANRIKKTFPDNKNPKEISIDGNFLTINGKKINIKKYSAKERHEFLKDHIVEKYQGCSEYYEIEFMLQIRQQYFKADPLLIAQEREQAFSKPVGKFFAEQEVKGAARLYEHIQMHKAVEKEAQETQRLVSCESPSTVSVVDEIGGDHLLSSAGEKRSEQQPSLSDLTLKALYKDFDRLMKLAGGAGDESNLKEAMRMSPSFKLYKWRHFSCGPFSTISQAAEKRMFNAYYQRHFEKQQRKIVAKQAAQGYISEDKKKYDAARKAWKKAQKEFTEIENSCRSIEKSRAAVEESNAAGGASHAFARVSYAFTQAWVGDAEAKFAEAEDKLKTAKAKFKSHSDKRPNKTHDELFDAAVADPEKGDDYQAAYDAVSRGMALSALGTTGTITACAAYPAYGIAHGGGLAAVAQTEAGKQIAEIGRECTFDTAAAFFVGRINAGNVQQAKNNNTQAQSGDLVPKAK